MSFTSKESELDTRERKSYLNSIINELYMLLKGKVDRVLACLTRGQSVFNPRNFR